MDNKFIITIIDWLKRSNRLKHLIGGFFVGLFFTFWAALGSASAMEFKDWQWGGRPSVHDFMLTVAGGLVGGALRLLIIWLIFKLLII